MIRIFLVLIFAIGAFAASCSEPSQTSDGMNEESKDEDVIGLTLSEAEKVAVNRGLIYRVTMIDGELQPGTRDLRMNRLNFVVENGKVVGVSRG